MLTHTGLSCVASLDLDAGTVTLIHSGLAAQKHKKDASPRVIPLGAIESVEYSKKTMLKRGHVRFILRGRSGFQDDVVEDVNGYLEKSASGVEFAQAVSAAAAAAEPVYGFGAAGSAAEVGLSTRERGQARIDDFQARTDQKFARRLEENARRLEAIGKKFEGFTLHDDFTLYELPMITHRGQAYPLPGARASIESAGIQRSRITATRVLGGAVLGSGTGALIGGMARKDTSKIYIVVELITGATLTEETDAKYEGDARQFADRVNAAAGAGSTSIVNSDNNLESPERSTLPLNSPPPPPPNVPAGWYPAPDGARVQRYWDGQGWTEHTAPLA